MGGLRRVASLFVLSVILAAGCGDASKDDSVALQVSDEKLTCQISTWTNQLGRVQTDPDIWRERLGRACTEGVSDSDAASQLAEEFIKEDLAVSARGDGLGPPTVGSGAQALWLMAVNVCRDAFPDGAIENGPPCPPSS